MFDRLMKKKSHAPDEETTCAEEDIHANRLCEAQRNPIDDSVDVEESQNDLAKRFMNMKKYSFHKHAKNGASLHDIGCAKLKDPH